MVSPAPRTSFLQRKRWPVLLIALGWTPLRRPWLLLRRTKVLSPQLVYVLLLVDAHFLASCYSIVLSFRFNLHYRHNCLFYLYFFLIHAFPLLDVREVTKNWSFPGLSEADLCVFGTRAFSAKVENLSQGFPKRDDFHTVHLLVPTHLAR